MKRYILFIIMAGALLGSQGMKAQSVIVDATIDSLQILIGQQARIKLQVTLDADKRAIFPLYPDTLVRGVEVLDVAKCDTQLLNNGQRAVLTQEYTVTSFDSALYYLPPMEVLVDNKPYHSKALALKVYSIPVDTLHPDQFFGPKTVMKAPFAWEDWYVSIAAALLFVPFLLALIYLVKRIRDNKPIIRKVRVEPKLPPHQLAMQEIERIKSEKIWQKGQPKEYYTELTDALRQYIKERFGFNAMEMTSTEIIDKLLETNDKEALSDLRVLFQTAAQSLDERERRQPPQRHRLHQRDQGEGRRERQAATHRDNHRGETFVAHQGVAGGGHCCLDGHPGVVSDIHHFGIVQLLCLRMYVMFHS